MLLDHLSKSLLLEKDFILLVADTSSSRYKKFQLQKQTGGFRKIFHPAKELKVLQRTIHENILSQFPIHNAATAYRQNTSVLTNARRHQESHYLLRVDFKNFFESISSNDIKNFLDSKATNFISEWTDEDTELLSKIACFHNKLTIGSVTSPILSNILCYELDQNINQYCISKSIIYTRYADDMFFSTCNKGELHKIPSLIKNIARNLSCPKNLWINYKKTIHTSKKKRMSVTGLVITNDKKISIGNKKKREIRTLVFKWEDITIDQKKYLQGYLSYCSSIEPSFINNLCTKYGATRINAIQKFDG